MVLVDLIRVPMVIACVQWIWRPDMHDLLFGDSRWQLSENEPMYGSHPGISR
jgi:hypothetical protein